MCCAINRDRGTRREGQGLEKALGAFTLFEVCVSVAIIALIALSIYRFIEANLRAITISTEQSNRIAQVEGLVATLQWQLNDLPLAEAGALLGATHKFGEKSADEMQWLCPAGNGVFTRFAPGRWHATLMLQPVPKTNTNELGLRRESTDGVDKNLHWLHLLDNVDALEMRYFDVRLNAWLEKWTDQQARPSLVRLRVWRTGEEEPFEVILTLPTTKQPS